MTTDSRRPALLDLNGHLVCQADVFFYVEIMYTVENISIRIKNLLLKLLN